MFSNYLKVALRNILRHKGYSLINILGLAIGMACCILLLLWVQDEVSYDKFHANGHQLYRVTEVWEDEEETELSVLTCPLLGPAVKEEIPEITHATRFHNDGEQIINYGEMRFQNDVVGMADNDFLQMFTFPLMAGNVNSALTDKFSVVITEDMSHKYFGTEDPIGEVLNIDRRDFVVTGVMENIPRNSHIRFDCVVPFDSRRDWLKEITDRWVVSSYYTYVMVNESSPLDEIVGKMNAVKERHLDASSASFGLQPVEDIHLFSGAYDYSEAEPGDIKYVYMFGALAVLILLIACINFMNLTTARSSNRVREIGVRKVVGANRGNIGRQFFGESVFLAVLAVILSVAIVELVLPAVNMWLGKSLNLPIFDNPWMIFGLLGLAGVTGIVAGSYPAVFLSAFQPVKVLKGKLDGGLKGIVFRKMLVVTQFAFSVFLIISAVLIYQQLHYMTKGDLGYDQDHLLTVRMRGGFLEDYENIKQDLMQNPNVLSISAGLPPSSLGWASTDLDWEGKDPDGEIGMNRYNVDYGYIETMGMEMADGRSFSREYSTDATQGYMLNEEAIKVMGLENPVGKRFSYEGREGTIVGVVRNFHQKSMHKPIYPLAMQINPEELKYMCIRLMPEGAPGIISFLGQRWLETANQYLFEYRFMDETLNNFYRSERRMGVIFRWSTILAISISCLGLFGLATFAAERRTKEIGIRKVLGASVANILKLLSQEIVLLVLIANVIAAPVAYYAMLQWLQNFVFRIDISWSVFGLTAVTALMIAIATVSFQAVKAALSNPVDALRYE